MKGSRFTFVAYSPPDMINSSY